MSFSVTHHTGNFKGADALSLFYQSWKPDLPEKNNRHGRYLKPAVLVFIHGMAEHSGRYQYPVEYFTHRGYIVYAMDLRGHGESGGRRSYAESFDHLMEDIRLFLEMVKKEQKRRKIFLVGHSFGGQLALNYGSRYPKSVDGIIVSSPNLRLRMPLSFLKRLAAPVLSRILPKVTFGNSLDPSTISRDPKVVDAYRYDPKVQKGITLRLADLVLENLMDVMQLAEKFRVPAFLMHGSGDAICCPDATREFYSKIPIRDKSYRIYDGFYHEIFNEIGRNQVFRDMDLWILKRL
jgi:acylglycerol lipase